MQALSLQTNRRKLFVCLINNDESRGNGPLSWIN
ncbi:hypothetical protein HCH_05607 [Hahella chejuensis KCTC 2396]|uniref:Uncharacterized protein n=1 Tax=Hahella chejuensis (strain KCTC 2396) TaxID=349521 RepID=Q2SAQ9_HAHCH|nr:hypothetical protein HCH_05607 [Hahella chejuensis KCTC 2396]